MMNTRPFQPGAPKNFVPMVIDQAEHWDRAYDLYSLLLKNRIVFLGQPVEGQLANLIVAQLLYLEREASQQPIHMYISSPGGDVYSGFAIYDAMQMSKAPIYTYAVGRTASMGTALLAAGASGHRYALPHATIHMHPATSGSQGYTEDVRIAFREQERVQTQLFHILGKHTGHTWKEIEETFARDRWLNAIDAQAFGLVDHVLGDTRDIVLRLEAGEIELAGPLLPAHIASNGKS
jgi:ATP-dependent Clp protease protease subunit